MFTTSIEQTLAQLERLHQQAQIARLAVGCLWLTSLRERDPRKAYKGPMGEMPLPYLQMLLELWIAGEPPQRVTTSALTGLIYKLGPITERKRTPPPADQVSQRITDAIAKHREPRQEYLLIRTIQDLRREGVETDDLRPLSDLLTEETVIERNRMDAGRLLITLGEWERGLAMLRSVPDHESIAYGWPTGAEHLMRIGHHAEGRRLLDDLMPRIDRLPAASQRQARNYAAVAYAYVGNRDLARTLIASEHISYQLEIEGAYVLGAKARGDAIDPASLLSVLDQVLQADPVEKSRAHDLTAILDILLTVEADEAALSLMDRLRETLIQIPVWGKREWRTNDAAIVLAPYAYRYPDRIYDFAAWLMLASAKKPRRAGDSDFWPTCQIVCGLVPLIGTFAEPEEMDWMLRAIKWWPNMPLEQGTQAP